MARYNEEEQAVEQATVIGLEAGYPPWQMPTLYVDGLANLAPISGNIKFYLYSTDPETRGQLPYKNRMVSQIVMPMPGFALAAAFIEKALKHFAAAKSIPIETINAARTAEQLELWPVPPSA